MSSQPLEPAAYDCVVVVTNHSGIDYDALVDEAVLVVDLRNATGHERTPFRQGLEAVSVRVGQAGLGEWGKNLARNFADLADLAWLCDPANGKRGRVRGPVPAGALGGDLRGDARGPGRSTPSSSRRPCPTHYELAKAALEAGKHVFVEKPPAMKGGEIDELVVARGRARPRPHARAPPALPPGRAEAEGAGRRRERSARCSASTATGRTSDGSGRTRTRCGRSASTTSR